MKPGEHILITGAAGRIGRVLTAHWREQYDLRLMDLKPATDTPDENCIQADITKLEQMVELCQDITTVVHLAADPSTLAVWESLLPNNIVGQYNVLEAAARAGCRRVIFASTINVVVAYPPTVAVTPDMPVSPGNLYGATKAWGEAVGRYYADFRGLSVLCLRLGWVADRNHPGIQPTSKLLSMLLTFQDAARLFDAALVAPLDLRFGIFHGISDNRHKRLNIDDTRSVLGYQPLDDGYALAGIPNA